MLETWSAVLGAIVDGARPWSTAAEIAETISCESELICDTLIDLEANGLVDPWAAGYTLSPLAAEGLKVHIIEYGLSRRPKWSRLPEPRAPRGRPYGDADPAPEGDRLPAWYAGGGAGPLDGRLGWVVDTSPGPDEIAEAADEAEHFRPRKTPKLDDLPRPTNLLTGSDPDWSEGHTRPRSSGRHRGGTFGVRKPGPCRACGDRPLSKSTYCLRCDRWGFDGLAASLARRVAAAAAAAEALKTAAARDAG